VTTYTQPELDVLAGMASDPRPSAVDDRAEIARAITRAAAEHRNLVTAFTIRRYVPATVNPAYIGSTVNRLARRGVLVATGKYRRNGNAGARNATKLSPLWRLERAIEPGDLA
jgi:hypothetical protein